VAFYQACWAHRRKHLPDDGALAERRGQTEVNRMICEQYAEGRAGLPREMAYHFRLPRRFLLSRDIAWKRTWLDSVLAARARSARRAGIDDSSLRLQRALLHNWLARARADNRASTRQQGRRHAAASTHPQTQTPSQNITNQQHTASPGRRENGRWRPSALSGRRRRTQRQNIPPTHTHTTFSRTKTKRSPLFLRPLRGFVNGPGTFRMYPLDPLRRVASKLLTICLPQLQLSFLTFDTMRFRIRSGCPLSTSHGVETLANVWSP
jgi:hypothetical protein